jgi:hypothetical protein
MWEQSNVYKKISGNKYNIFVIRNGCDKSRECTKVMTALKIVDKIDRKGQIRQH